MENHSVDVLQRRSAEGSQTSDVLIFAGQDGTRASLVIGKCSVYLMNLGDW